MKLVLKIKILPSDEQRSLLLQTMEEANKACSYISDIAWANKTFGQFKIHHLCYDDVRQRFNLSAQMVVRCISKVADAYKLDHKKKREFRTYGSISYDARILSYKEAKPPSGLLGSVRRFRSSAITKNTFLTSREKQTLHSRKETSISIRLSMSPNPKSRIRTLL